LVEESQCVRAAGERVPLHAKIKKPNSLDTADAVRDVVTGAASGIGRALADHCVHEGMKVVLADGQERKAARNLVTVETTNKLDRI